jgi:simple sugar transport system permease protein
VTALTRLASGRLDAVIERATGAGGMSRALVRPLLAVLLALVLTALLILAAGKNPLLAYAALVDGALGSWDRIGVGLNKATPYVLTGVGVALCFRARAINIGGEGQIALGGLAATWMTLAFPATPPLALPALALAAGAGAGAGWAALGALIRLHRNVHEVLVTLLMNFVGVLVVSEALQGQLGEPGAGFPQSPLLPRAAWLPRFPGGDLHVGILVAVVVVIAGHALLWRTPFGFRLRVLGASVPAATYAGISEPRTFLGVMSLAGALAGLAGAVEVLGVHYRLIEGFSHGFGFNAVAIALLGALNPIAVLPAGLFFGFLETGALAMQRAIGVPSSLVSVIQGLTMVFILAAMGLTARRART